VAENNILSEAIILQQSWVELHPICGIFQTSFLTACFSSSKLAVAFQVSLA